MIARRSSPAIFLAVLLAFGPSGFACFLDPVSQVATIPSRQACYAERDCKNANSNCVAYSMVLYDEIFDCNLLGNNPEGSTDGIYCDPLVLAYDCSFASQSCFAGCDSDPN